MLRNSLILVFICLVGYGIGMVAFQRAPEPITRRMPAFTLSDIHGNTITTETLAGKVVLMNFWATWCAPCVKEFPNLLSLAADNPDDVTLLALSSDLNREAIDQFVMTHGFQNAMEQDNVIIALDTRNIGSNLFDVHKLPETLVIDPSGVIVDHIIGAEWDTQDIQNIIDKIK